MHTAKAKSIDTSIPNHIFSLDFKEIGCTFLLEHCFFIRDMGVTTNIVV